MPSTFTPSLKIELIGNGEQPTTWGITTNNNMGTLIEQSIAGVQPITLTGNTVLSNFNGISDQARNAVLVFNGALSNTANVIAPSVEKTYIVSNRAGANVVIKTATGVGISVSNNTSLLIYCDGAEFYTAVTPNDVIGNLSVSGNQTVAGSISIGGNITINNKITSNAGTLTLNSSTGVVDMVTNSGAFTPPTGTDGERPGSPDLGMTRWNSTQGILEIWNGVQWQNITGNYAVEYLLVAGGGAGGGAGGFGNAGGGGAGGLLANSTTVTVGIAYPIVVGSGGATFAAQGANTTAFSITAVGGGGGGNNAGNGGNGGSGGGAARGDDGVPKTGGSATSGQGFAGGNTNGTTGSAYGAAGGGGAGAVGQDGQTFGGGNGGAGSASSITGTSVTRAGGGGGAGGDNAGSGGAGGGGAGGGGGSPNGVAGTANTGGGGGGIKAGGAQTNFGGSGVAIIRYASASQRGTGGTVTSYSDAGITYFVHTFNSSGTFTA
jgi:hypothetical protein